ncbi:extracellular solute-binding protein [Acidimangrovimonas sediminis]|uniref:extracellular solute-binding protein n=1 Tax=Acidimangrovimonas sediminis TaxID=2056283 RepID=UPI000C808B79
MAQTAETPASSAAPAAAAGSQEGAKAERGDVITSYGISTFGKLKYPEGFKHLDYVNPDAPKGGEISEWQFGGFDNMNPYTVQGRAAGLSSIFYESLMVGTDDEVGASYCLICKTLEYPKDRAWVIFTLRPDVTFSDGTPMTAEDVKFSYEQFRDHGLPSLRAVLQRQVESAEVLGKLKVKFTFKTGVPTRDLPATVGGLPIFEKAEFVRDKRSLEESSLKPFVGSGPYVLDHMNTGQEIVYKRNPDYWGWKQPLNVGRWNFDKIRLEYYADYNAAFEGFKGGTYTFRSEASSKLWATGYNFPGVQKGNVKKVELPNGNLATSQSFIFNLRKPRFQDIRVREAIALMFNFEWSNKTLFYGVYDRLTSFWQNSDLAAKGKPSPAEQALLKPVAKDFPGDILTDEAAMPEPSGERQLDRRNLRRASKLLDAAGWKVGPDGMRENAQGEKLRVEFLNDSPSFDRVINPLVENLRRLGVDAVNTRVDNAQMTDRERTHDFDVITAQFPMSLIPGSGLEQFFGSKSADAGEFNKMGLENPGVDKLIGDVEAADSQGDLDTAVHALDRALRSLHFWIPQWYNAHYLVAYYDIFDHPKTLPPYALGELDLWWYDKDKAAKLKAEGVRF